MVQLLNEKKNPLFDRKHVTFEVESPTTPSHADAIKLVAKECKTDEDKISILAIKGKFGTQTVQIDAKVYGTLEEKNRIEKHNKKEKKK